LSPTETSLIIWALLVGGSLCGVLLRRVLPQHYLDAHAKDIVRLGCALIATISGLVLGLLINSANTSFNTQRDEIRQMSANLILVDQLLQQYGPEARSARQILRNAVPAMVKRLWSDGAMKAGAMTFAGTHEGASTYHALRSLKPTDAEQRYFQTQALQVLTAVAQTRFILFEQSNGGIPTPFLVILVFWLVLLFTSFSLFSPMSPAAFVALVLIALSASGAIFLILEMFDAFGGAMQISSEPLRQALAPLP
jgi:hypothetical protein